MEKDRIYDISIIGAGPVGLFGVFCAGMRKMSVALVDSLPQVGGQLNAIYPEKYIYDVPGFPQVRSKDLVASLYKQALFAKPDLYLNSEVESISSDGDKGELYSIQIKNGKTIRSRTILLSLGIGAFQPRKLDLKALEDLEGSQVHYIMKPLDYYQGKDILLIGGGDSAADWSLALGGGNGKNKVAKSITHIHRGVKFTAHEAKKNSFIDILLSTELKDVQQKKDNRLICSLENNENEKKKVMEYDHIIICAGYIAKLGFTKEMGFERNRNSILVNEFMETNKKRIFAAGDLADHKGKLKLIVTGFGEASVAVNVAKTYVDPEAKAFPGHSTFLMHK